MEQKQHNQTPQSHDGHISMADQRVLEGVSDQILKKYMDERDCIWESQHMRDRIRESSGFQLHLACVRFNEALRKLWESVPWYRKILIKVSSWLNAL